MNYLRFFCCWKSMFWILLLRLVSIRMYVHCFCFELHAVTNYPWTLLLFSDFCHLNHKYVVFSFLTDYVFCLSGLGIPRCQRMQSLMPAQFVGIIAIARHACAWLAFSKLVLKFMALLLHLMHILCHTWFIMLYTWWVVEIGKDTKFGVQWWWKSAALWILAFNTSSVH